MEDEMVTALSDNDRQLIAMMNAAETALGAGDFAIAKEEFYRLLQMPDLPAGDLTAWPHVPSDLGWPYPEPHLPTREDVLLGLGLSSLGLGDIDVAKSYIEKSGFLALRWQFVQGIREKRRKSESETHEDFHSRMYAKARSPKGDFRKTGHGLEGAAKSAIRQSYDWAMQGDWARVKQLFEFLWELLGVTYGYGAFNEILTCAYRAQGEHFGTAAFYFFQTIRFEPTFCSNAIDGVLRCAQALIRQRNLREAKEILEQIELIPIAELNEDWEMDISEYIERRREDIQYVYDELLKATTRYYRK